MVFLTDTFLEDGIPCAQVPVNRATGITADPGDPGRHEGNRIGNSIILQLRADRAEQLHLRVGDQLAFTLHS
jgi:hypothetical protein